jgi:hypothetical protein
VSIWTFSMWDSVTRGSFSTWAEHVRGFAFRAFGSEIVAEHHLGQSRRDWIPSMKGLNTSEQHVAVFLRSSSQKPPFFIAQVPLLGTSSQFHSGVFGFSANSEAHELKSVLYLLADKHISAMNHFKPSGVEPSIPSIQLI